MGQKLKSNLELIFISNLSADYESTPMILRSEEDEEVDIVTDTDEDDAQQHFIAYQQQQQQRNSKHQKTLLSTQPKPKRVSAR